MERFLSYCQGVRPALAFIAIGPWMLASFAASCSTREPVAGCSSDVGARPVDGAADSLVAADVQRFDAEPDASGADAAPDHQPPETAPDAPPSSDSADSQSLDAAADTQGLDAASELPAFDAPLEANGSCLAASDASTPDAHTGAGAGCPAAIESPPLLPAVHVPIGTDIQWCSNPPSSGPHYPIWAAYQAYDAAVPRGYYVHDLEHGAVVFLYKCGDAGCPNVVAALHAAADAIPNDPLCDADGGVRVRAVITSDPLLDVPVAAAAWGWTYKAQCVDLAALTAFARQHYGQGPESFCSNGTTQF
jgi:hypothetical protein